MDDYYKKYLKYKKKYLELKDDKYFDLKTKKKYLELKDDKINQKGGRYIKNYNGINRFYTIEYPEMEEFLNPIYGCFLAESDFIRNNYFLYKANIDLDELRLNDNFELSENPSLIINNNLRKKISKLMHNIPNTPIVEPTNEIKQLKSLDIGRFIAILYFVKMNEGLISYEKGNFKCWFNNGQEPEKIDTEILNKYIDKIGIIKDYIKIGTKDKMDFYLLLYCLWNKINDDTAIDSYYQGIQEVFNITNKYSPNIYNICPSVNTSSNILFEEAVIKTITTDFIVFQQNYARPFCHNDEYEIKYPDCGETTMRNLINLICFKDGIFDVDTLKQYHAISGLIEYYTIFNNFAKQSSNNKKKIYDLDLDARDAWSHLIIHKANNNLTFNQHCFVNRNNYNLKASSKTADGKSINSFQLLKNLLPNVEEWNHLNKYNDNIETITTNLNQDGVGTIEIDHKIFCNIKIQYTDGHAYWYDIVKQTNFSILHLPKNKQKIINILKRQNITESNYLFFKYNENILELLDKNLNANYNLFEILLKISLTNIIDSEIREQIEIHTNMVNIMKIWKQYKLNKGINNYKYICDDFNFITEYIPQLENLNCQIHNIINVNLAPLCNIQSIGDWFLGNCFDLITIENLSALSNVISIGDFFLGECYSLQEINLSALTNIKSIGGGFLYNCMQLKNINLSPLVNITMIGSDFLANCYNLTTIDLSPLTKIKSIDYGFLDGCSSLTTIDLYPLSNIKIISSGFLAGCKNLNKIDLSPLKNCTMIENRFLSGCSSLIEINLLPLINIHSVNDYFLAQCKNIYYIDLSSLCNLISIKIGFLVNCSNLLTIDLSPLSNVTSIDSYFLAGCTNLKTVDLRPLVNLRSLGKNFLDNCTKITEILITPQQNISLSILRGMPKVKISVYNND